MTITDERDTTEETAYDQCSEKCEDEFERFSKERWGTWKQFRIGRGVIIIQNLSESFLGGILN